MSVLRIVVLASGEGSNFQALIDAIESHEIEQSRIVGLIVDSPKARAIQRAIDHKIPVFILPFPEGARRGSPVRVEYDERLASLVTGFKPDIVLLLGWMRLLSHAFLSGFPDKVINLHPALPGTFPGTHAIERAFEAFSEGKIEKTGVMLHSVPNEGVDSGPVLKCAEVPIFRGDTLEGLESRIHVQEHMLVVELVRDLARNYTEELLPHKEI